ncbi:MAG TPA: hypothetical protein VFH68_02875 [Polyangia bacterium]|nr:hypothetical protein [Polyangia bacterium]
MGFLALHAGTPLLAIPFFVAAGADPVWSIAASALGCGFALVSYHFMAVRADLTRLTLRARDRERAHARDLEQEVERRQLARNLHDSVGSALSLFGLCGDLNRSMCTRTRIEFNATLGMSSGSARDELR